MSSHQQTFNMSRVQYALFDDMFQRLVVAPCSPLEQYALNSKTNAKKMHHLLEYLKQLTEEIDNAAIKDTNSEGGLH